MWPNTNTNICYSNNIRILFEYRIIRSPLTSLQNKICFQFFFQGSLRKNNLSSLSPGLHTLLEVNIYFDRNYCINPLLKLKHCIKACLLGFYNCNINGLILNWVYIKFAICQVSWTRHTWERLPRGAMWTLHSMATTILTMIVFVYFLMKSNSVENITWWYCVWDLHMVVFETFTWNIFKLENITWWYCLKPSRGTFINFSDAYRGK